MTQASRQATGGRVLDDFEGAWLLSRRIRHGDGTQARFEGRAVWSPSGGGLRYHETGTLRMPGQPDMQAERGGFWDADLNVYFDDGRFFHAVPPQGGAAAHWCDPDQYDGVYDFSRWPDFNVQWRVVGPRKDYRMHSIYRPQTAPPLRQDAGCGIES